MSWSAELLSQGTSSNGGGSILRVLTVGRTANDAEPLVAILRDAGYGVFPRHVSGSEDMLAVLAAEEWDVVLFGADVEGLDVTDAVAHLHKADAATAVIVVYDEHRTDGPTCVVNALQAGARDAVSRANPVHLQLVVSREIQRVISHRVSEKAIRACAEMEDRCMSLLRSSSDAIAYVHQGMHVYANACYAKAFGYSELDDLLGIPLMNVIVQREQKKFKKFLRDCCSSESEVPSFKATCIDAAGDEFEVTMELKAVTYEGERCWQVVARPAVSEHDEETNGIVTNTTDHEMRVQPTYESAGMAKVQSSQVMVGKELAKRESIESASCSIALSNALARNRLSLLFQPIVSLQGDSTAIYEVHLHAMDPIDILAGMRDPDTASKVDEWILEEALTVLVEQQRKCGDVRVFLKLSDYSFKSERLLLSLRERLKCIRLDGQSLILQINEASALEQMKNVYAFVNGLKLLGCRSAIDHVGQTSNAIEHLRDLPVDYLKLDSSLCERLMKGKEGHESLGAIVALARAKGIQTIATGVAEADCLTLLWQTGVDLAQGRCIQEPNEIMAYDFGNEN